MESVETIIIQNTLTFTVCVAFGLYIGFQSRKKEDLEAKFNWLTLIMAEGAVIAGSVLSWIVLR